jgi:hypothetical protein
LYTRLIGTELAFTVAVDELQATDPALLGLTSEALRGTVMVRSVCI